jgi:hypothetical protein
MPASTARNWPEERDPARPGRVLGVLDNHGHLAIGVRDDGRAAEFCGDVRLGAPLELGRVTLSLIAHRLFGKGEWILVPVERGRGSINWRHAQ